VFTYEARIKPAVGGLMINVRLQARQLIESLYGPIKVWQFGSNKVS
jgi:hypothetical protein